MMKLPSKNLVFPLILLFTQCESVKNQESVTMSKPTDPHSFSIPSDARVTHLKWRAEIDFETKTVHALASWSITPSADADIILFDTKDLTIKSVTLDNNNNTEYKLAQPDSLLGQALAVMIRPDTKTVNIEYETSPHAEALQWLTPQQTAGKKFPFLFTQSQAILARSWVPCQDSPSVRFTYEAEVTGPKDLLILMSASNPKQKNNSGAYRFQMDHPIPSYLLALTVGDLTFQPVSERCGVYAEPSMIESASWELADLDKMIQGAEELYGAYQWGRYDVLVLPPSFPFGGMENPRLTFATPTILAGDRSLTSLIAHELAHSWSGNLVTNATWNDFWLNEGFTVYFEHRIMEKLYGKDYAEMLAALALHDLQETIESLKQDNQFDDTKLFLNLNGRHPDDGVTDIAYNKGYFFLRYIEERHGRETFDTFVKDYFSTNAFTSITTEKFIAYIKAYYLKEFRIDLKNSLFDAWIFSVGLPPDCPKPVSARFIKVDHAVAEWKKSGILNKSTSKEWSTHEWLHFLKSLPDALTPDQMARLDAFGNFTASGNAEITTLWLVHAIRNKYVGAYPKLEQFLINTGRRKFLSPLYHELIKTEEGKHYAKSIYDKARPNYHFVSTNTFDKLLR